MFRGLPASVVRAPRLPLVLVGAAFAVTVLSGCSAATPEPSAAPATSTAAKPPASAPPAAPQEDPQLVPAGTAADNLPLFAHVTAQIWAGDQRASGAAYIDALTAAGFDRDRMQVTADHTTIGNPVESLQFAVGWGDAECLIGQVGPSTGEPVTTVMPQLDGGRCLVGETRPIDW